MRRISRYLPLLFVLVCYIPFASAQSSFDIGVGFGAVQDKAASSGLDQNLNSCALGTAGCTQTPSLSSFMLGIGGDLMLWKKFGVGAEVNIQPAKQTYVDLTSSAASVGLSTLSLQSRVTLYDFNGVFEPVNTKKVAVKLSGGIGGANIKFYESGSSSNSLVGSQNFSQYFGSSNHFQVHGGAGVQIYLTDHIFVRPQFDIHYVHNLSQFGRNLITEETVWLGYSWGDRP
ncbi:MAG TPA: outer membrane beta-barrel protein [Candidatus Sulfopaludibacter sp.]|nr:outer membrane beta-barrel protein [Candidatus Sulfopaludibacter sp.]